MNTNHYTTEEHKPLHYRGTQTITPPRNTNHYTTEEHKPLHYRTQTIAKKNNKQTTKPKLKTNQKKNKNKNKNKNKKEQKTHTVGTVPNSNR
jgi:hypothetical protein